MVCINFHRKTFEFEEPPMRESVLRFLRVDVRVKFMIRLYCILRRNILSVKFKFKAVVIKVD